MEGQIEEILNEYVRPKLLEHEGGVQVVEYTDRILKVRLTGKCSGCPSASLTTEEMIKHEVISRIPEIQDVVLVTGVSDDLIAQARMICSQRQERKNASK